MPKHNKHQIPLTEVYKHYKENAKNPLDYKTHKLVLDTWGELVSDAIAEGKDIKLFSGLATLGVRKKKCKTYIDKRASKEAGKIVRSSNSHSGFFNAKVLWKRHYTRFSSANWSFHTTKALQKKITAVMSEMDGHKRYLQKMNIAVNEDHRKAIYNKKVLGL